MPAKRSVTSRGFVIYDEFEDSQGRRVVVRESSAADRPGSKGPFLWVMALVGEVSGATGPLHLSYGQAVRLRDALEDFLADVARRDEEAGR